MNKILAVIIIVIVQDFAATHEDIPSCFIEEAECAFNIINIKELAKNWNKGCAEKCCNETDKSNFFRGIDEFACGKLNEEYNIEECLNRCTEDDFEKVQHLQEDGNEFCNKVAPPVPTVVEQCDNYFDEFVENANQVCLLYSEDFKSNCIAARIMYRKYKELRNN